MRNLIRASLLGGLFILEPKVALIATAGVSSRLLVRNWGRRKFGNKK